MGEELTPKNDFVREKIKDKPKSKKKLLLHLLYMALCGLVFGLVVALVLAICIPRIIKKTGIHESQSVQESLQAISPTSETEAVAPVEKTVIEYEQLTLDDFQVLQNQLYAIGQECNKSIVSILGVTSDTDIFNKPYEVSGTGSGVIIRDAGSEILILTEARLVSKRSEIYVTFVDGTSSPATVKGQDSNTGLAVLSVAKKELGTDTIGRIGVAIMNEFGSPQTGSMVIALGNPLGAPYSIVTGNITSISNEVSGWDHNYEVLTTDIVGSENGSGILVNTRGEIVGFIMQSYGAADSANILTAVKISEIKPVINRLCEGNSVPYLGMKVSTITAKMEEQYGIPRGAYVRSVAMDSPAMNIGLQSGDVIVRMNGEAISSDNAYSVHLLASNPGSTMSLVVKRKGANGYSEIKYTVTVGDLQ